MTKPSSLPCSTCTVWVKAHRDRDTSSSGRRASAAAADQLPEICTRLIFGIGPCRCSWDHWLTGPTAWAAPPRSIIATGVATQRRVCLIQRSGSLGGGLQGWRSRQTPAHRSKTLPSS